MLVCLIKMLSAIIALKATEVIAETGKIAYWSYLKKDNIGSEVRIQNLIHYLKTKSESSIEKICVYHLGKKGFERKHDGDIR